MAITKIHPIKSTLNLAIDYITKSEKTDEKILISSFKCHPSTAHIQFMKTREDNDTKGKVLARSSRNWNGVMQENFKRRL